MIAEGGTEYGHMETIARSTSPWGPFDPCPHNPILTHRNQGAHVIQGTGHADLVQSADGQWWTVFLAFRQAKQYRQYHHLGRETFLAPVSWNEAGWSLIDPIELTMNANIQPVVEWPSEPIRDDFEGKSLKHVWNFLRNQLAVVRESEGFRVIVRRRIGDLIAIVARQPIDQGEIILQIDANAELYTFSYSQDKEHFQVLATASTQYLSSEVAGGFTGVYFGLYATGNGKPSSSNADFDWIDYS